MEVINIYFSELFTLNKNDLVGFVLLSIYIGFTIVKNHKNNNRDNPEGMEIFDVSVVDNKAYWSYNSNIYVADFYNNKIVSNTIKKVSIEGISKEDAEDVISMIGKK